MPWPPCPLSWMLVHAKSISFATVHPSNNPEIYNIGAHAQWFPVNRHPWQRSGSDVRAPIAHWYGITNSTSRKSPYVTFYTVRFEGVIRSSRHNATRIPRRGNRNEDKATCPRAQLPRQADSNPGHLGWESRVLSTDPWHSICIFHKILKTLLVVVL